MITILKIVNNYLFPLSKTNLLRFRQHKHVIVNKHTTRNKLNNNNLKIQKTKDFIPHHAHYKAVNLK